VCYSDLILTAARTLEGEEHATRPATSQGPLVHMPPWTV
jgi:hypothetical protein